jgi:hypothetical protein
VLVAPVQFLADHLETLYDIDLAGREQAEAAGFETVWVNDNFKARHTFSLLGAVAARHQVGLGTLVTYPYARNPMDLATALGTLAELSARVRCGWASRREREPSRDRWSIVPHARPPSVKPWTSRGACSPARTWPSATTRS